MALDCHWPLDGSGDELGGAGVCKHPDSTLACLPESPLSWALVGDDLLLPGRWEVWMVMSRERKAKKGLEVLDESQEIPELAAYKRGPQMPFLGFLCRLRQVSFELGPGSHHASPPDLLPPPQVTGDKRGS